MKAFILYFLENITANHYILPHLHIQLDFADSVPDRWLKLVPNKFYFIVYETKIMLKIYTIISFRQRLMSLSVLDNDRSTIQWHYLLLSF